MGMEALIETRYLLVIVSITILVMWIVQSLMTRPKNLPPGPSGLPLIGVAITMMRTKLDPLRLFMTWADTYGDIMSFSVGPVKVVVLNSYQTIVDAFQNPNLNDRPRSRMLEEAIGIGNNGIVLSNGEVWKEQRKFVHSVFRSLGVGKKSYEDTIAAEMEQLMGALEETNGRPFDPNNVLTSAISNVICSIVFGTQYKYSDPDFQRILHLLQSNFELSSGGSALLFIPLPGISKIPFGAPRQLVQNFKHIQAYLLEMVNAHEKEFDPNNPKDFIDLYLKKMTDTKGEETSFNKINLEASMADLFAAGTETTSTSLKWALLYMMTYPEVQVRVQKELDHVIGRERLPRLDDSKDLPFTNAVLLEIQRKGVVAPLGVPHVAAADTSFYGYTIPKGATIVPNIWRVMNNDNLWKQADSFNPERFLSEEGELIKREELIFFSAGRRVCLGEQLARMELFLCFASLLHRFTFKKPDNSPPLSVEGVLGLTRNTLPYETCAFKR